MCAHCLHRWTAWCVREVTVVDLVIDIDTKGH